MTARKITWSAELARQAGQTDAPFVLGILGKWRILTADQFKQDPDKSAQCWTASISELLDVLQPTLRRRRELDYGLKDAQDSVQRALSVG